MYLHKGTEGLGGIASAKLGPSIAKDWRRFLWAPHTKHREQVSVSKWDNDKTPLALPPIHVVIDGSAAQQHHIQLPHLYPNPQMGEAEPCKVERPNCTDPIITQMTGQSIFVGF